MYNKEICQICGNEIKLDKCGNGLCKKCRWYKNDEAINRPNEVIYPNITSFYHAKELNKSNKTLKPTYDEFITIVLNNFEPYFKYKDKNYGCTNFDGYEFFEWNNKDSYQTYKNIEDFKQKVNINGVLLSSIWDEIKNFELSC